MAVMRTTRRRIAATAAAAALGIGTTLPAQAAPAEGQTVGAGSPDAVKDSYLVILKAGSGLKASSAAGKSLVNGHGTHVAGTVAGTSMATPHVAGAAAIYLAGHPSASPSTVAGALVNGATSGVLSGIGTGSPNLLLRVVP